MIEMLQIEELEKFTPEEEKEFESFVNEVIESHRMLHANCKLIAVDLHVGYIYTCYHVTDHIDDESSYEECIQDAIDNPDRLWLDVIQSIAKIHGERYAKFVYNLFPVLAFKNKEILDEIENFVKSKLSEELREQKDV